MHFRKVIATAAIATGSTLALSAPAIASQQEGYETLSIHSSYEDCGRVGHLVTRTGPYGGFQCKYISNPNGSHHYALQVLR